MIPKKTNSFYRGNDCIKKFCSELKELGTKVVNYEQKEEKTKIALNRGDNERLQTFDSITAYPYGTNAFKVCEGEMLSKMNV